MLHKLFLNPPNKQNKKRDDIGVLSVCCHTPCIILYLSINDLWLTYMYFFLSYICFSFWIFIKFIECKYFILIRYASCVFNTFQRPNSFLIINRSIYIQIYIQTSFVTVDTKSITLFTQISGFFSNLHIFIGVL